MKMKQIRSRIKEFITAETMDMIHKVYLKRNINNNERARMIQDVLDVNGVENVLLGPGTNRVAFLIDGYVFKFAMDSWGVKDNYNELASTKELQPFVVKTYETNGLINVCEYVTLMSSEEFANPRVEAIIVDTLGKLSSSYLLGDVGYTPKNFTNWGYREDGSIVILDYAYIYQVETRDILCSHDGAMLNYNTSFTGMYCPECHAKYDFMDVRRRISTQFEADAANSVLSSAYKVTSPKMMVPDVDIDELEGDEEFLVRRSDIIKDEDTPQQNEPQEEISEKEYFKRMGYDIATDDAESSQNMFNSLQEMMMRANHPEPDPEPELDVEEPAIIGLPDELLDEPAISIGVTEDDTDEEVGEGTTEEVSQEAISISTSVHEDESGAITISAVEEDGEPINIQIGESESDKEDAPEINPMDALRKHQVGVTSVNDDEEQLTLDIETPTIKLEDVDDEQVEEEKEVETKEVEEPKVAEGQLSFLDSLLDGIESKNAVSISGDEGLPASIEMEEDNSKYEEMAEEHGFDSEEDLYQHMQARQKKWR